MAAPKGAAKAKEPRATPAAPSPEPTQDTTPVDPSPVVEAPQTPPAGEADPAILAESGSDAGVDAEAAAARAAALADLAAGRGPADEEAPGGSEDVPAPVVPPALTGQLVDWGGDVPHLVVAYLFHLIEEDGTIQTAYEGDVIAITAEQAERGVDLGVIRPIDEDSIAHGLRVLQPGYVEGLDDDPLADHDLIDLDDDDED